MFLLVRSTRPLWHERDKSNRIMADLLMTCPHCQQPVTCDELLAGQELQCPGCDQSFIAPAAIHGPPPAASSKASPFRQQPPAAPTRSPQSRLPVNQPSAESKGGAIKWIKIVAVLVVLGVGGYF